MAQPLFGNAPQQFPKDTTIGGLKLGSLEDVLVAASNLTLLPSDNGSVTIISPGATVTLPALASVPTGATFHFRTSSTGANRIVKGNGAEQIVLGTGQGNTAALRDGETLSLVAGGIGWVNVGGVAGLENTAGFGASLVGNGWQRLPSGLILQWTTGTTNASGVASIAYPIAFPNNLLKIVATAAGINSVVTVGASSTTSATINCYTGSTGAGKLESVGLIAIGN